MTLDQATFPIPLPLEVHTEAELATRLEAGPVIRFSTSVMATRATQEAAQ